jgi:UTP--glucose-1-phosphate uridylyltransferase
MIHTNTYKRVKKAIFPVAGLGTRFLPATKACPKEMLVVVDKPLIQYAVEEAYAAGIREMIFVTGRAKRSIEDHFDTAYELENELYLHGKDELNAAVQSVKPDDMHCIFIRQSKALGLGHAVFCAAPLIQDEPVAVLLADDLMVATPCVMSQLCTVYASYGSSVIAVQRVPPQHTKKYGIVTTGACISEQTFCMEKVVEKPDPAVAPSNLAIVGRYILTPRIFYHLSHQAPKAGGEIQLTDAIASLIKEEQVLTHAYEGKRYDCGTKLGLLQASIDLGMTHSEIGEELKEWIINR